MTVKQLIDDALNQIGKLDVVDKPRMASYAVLGSLRYVCMELQCPGTGHLFVCGYCAAGKFHVKTRPGLFTAGPCPNCGTPVEAITEDGRKSVQIIDTTCEDAEAVSVRPRQVLALD